MHREQLRARHVEHAEPVERLPALLLVDPLRDGILLELCEAELGVRVLDFEPVFAGARVVLAADVPALYVGEIVLEV